jgi:hypothetical protein
MTSYKQTLHDYFKKYTYETESDIGAGSLIRLTRNYYNPGPTNFDDYNQERMIFYINAVIKTMTELVSELETTQEVKHNIFYCMLCNKSNLFAHATEVFVNMCFKYCLKNIKVLLGNLRLSNKEYGYHRCFAPRVDPDCIKIFIISCDQESWIKFVNKLIQEYSNSETMIFLHYMLEDVIRNSEYPNTEKYTNSGILLLENLLTNVINTSLIDTESYLANAYGLCLDVLDNYSDALFNYFINNRKKILRLKSKYANITSIDTMEQKYTMLVETLYKLDVFPNDLVQFIVKYVSDVK